jgi:membrane associated rhomboid family serine protease
MYIYAVWFQNKSGESYKQQAYEREWWWLLLRLILMTRWLFLCVLSAIICGAIVGLLCAILLVMFIVYRMRKKDEGSYVLDDSKRTTPSYGKSKEFFA